MPRRDSAKENPNAFVGRQTVLLGTFTLGGSAAVVATALQVEETTRGWCLAASIVLAAAFLLTILVILWVRVAEPNAGTVMHRVLRVPRSPKRVVDLLIKLEGKTRAETRKLSEPSS